MRCLYDSQGKHIAFEESGNLYDCAGLQIGIHATILATDVDQEILFAGPDGNYLCEIIAEAPDRLLLMAVPDERRRFSVGSFTPNTIQTIECPNVESLESLPEGFIDVEF